MNFLKFWDFPKFVNQIPVFGNRIPNFGIRGSISFFISEVDAELPFALRKISFKRVGVRSGVA